MDYPYVSVIVPTFNREEPLCQTLQALFNQRYPYYEIIVVDQTQQHALETISFLESNKDKICYYHLDRPGLPNAKNFGSSFAKGEILLFCDDDMIPIPDFIKHHVENYRNPNIGCVASRIIPMGYVRRPFTFFRLKLIGGKIAPSGRYFCNWNSDRNGYVDTCGGTVISVRKNLIERIDGFDTLFKGTFHHEDVDLGYRLRRLGIKIIYEPRAEVLHLYYPKGGVRIDNSVKAEYFRFRNCIIFYLKNMNKFLLPYMLIVFFLIATKKILIPTRSIKNFFYVLSGLWDGFKTYIKRKKNGK